MRLENLELTEEEMLNDTLSSCKSLLSLLNIYATEASNEEIEDVIEDLYLQMKDNQRNLYKVMYKKGWYKLEKEDTKKINNAITKFNNYKNELSK
jgi:spore coat protein CotF